MGSTAFILALAPKSPAYLVSYAGVHLHAEALLISGAASSGFNDSKAGTYAIVMQ